MTIDTQQEEGIHRTTINVNQSPQRIQVNGSTLSLNSGCYRSNETDAADGVKTDSPVPFRKKTPEQAEIDETNVNFTQNREQWQRRANSQSNIKISHTLKANRQSEGWVHRQNYTPDLVMDLPLVGNSSPKETAKKPIPSDNGNADAEEDVEVKQPETPTGPESPDMTTAAERFAKQNQCTLKKNTKVHVDSAGLAEQVSDLVAITSPVPDRKYATISNATTTTFKPQVKAKPPVLKKPAFSVPVPGQVSVELRKDEGDLPT